MHFLPAPDNWKQVTRLPERSKQAWVKSMHKEVKELIKKGTFEKATPKKDDPMVPVTAKYRVKLSPDGSIEKLKTRVALRGDMLNDTQLGTFETWCPIANFKSIKFFLGMAAHYKQRV